MLHFLTGTSATLKPACLAGIGRYRHKVFVEQLGWQLRCQHALEYDQFDMDDTVYVVALDADGDVVGTARLLPTTGPYLLAQVFPELLGGEPAPRSAQAWELSRFAAGMPGTAGAAPVGHLSSPAAVQLLRHSLSAAAAHGARRVLTVSPVAVGRLLDRAGFRAHTLGPTLRIAGQATAAFAIDCGA